MLKSVKNAMETIGEETGDVAKRIGSGTAKLAKRIGPRNAIIGVAVLGVLVGGSIWLVRYLQARREEMEEMEGGEPHRMSRRAAKRHAAHGPNAQATH